MRTTITARAKTQSLAPIRAGSLVSTIHRQVREVILKGSLPAGEPLRDSVLATQMAVSRAPVREALRLLEQSGLIEKSANKPYRVKVFEREDLSELAVLRIALETTAARLVVAQRRDTSEMQQALADMHAVWDERVESDLNDIDLKFHRAIVAASGVDRLLQKYDDLVDQMVLAWLRLSEEVPREVGSLAVHDEIVHTFEQCIAAEDPGPIQQVLIDHIRTGMGCRDLLI